jgi:hypothetical protein
VLAAAYLALNQAGEGSSPSDPTDDGRASRLATAAVLKTVEQQCLEGSTPSPSAACALGRAAKAPVFQTGQAGPIPAGHSDSGVG